MPPAYFPLRWESTGDQWWYASPIDWAAANGHYDLVRELLHIDTNLLIKLTSLRRIRRLETLWDDDARFDDVARSRSHVARKLLLGCQNKKRHNSLIKAGYGGWLLYTAASAGDVDFCNELLERNPLLVFGEGEYSVSDILYAAARSKDSGVFRLLFNFSVSGKGSVDRLDLLEGQTEKNVSFRWEMINRAAHAAARGGNLEMLEEIVGDCSDVLVYNDAQGSSLLHSASGRGQGEAVKHLIATYDHIITARDNQGNTALNVATYRGHLGVAEILIGASMPSASLSLTNNYGDTFLHMAVAGFQTPGFRRLDRQMELMKELLSGKLIDMGGIINAKNNNGRTALHLSVIGDLHVGLVELLISEPSADLNALDANGLTALDLLKQRPRSASSEILIRRLASAGALSNCEDHRITTGYSASHVKTQGVGSSPGTSFRIPDAEMVLYYVSETGFDAMIAGDFSDEPSTYDSEAGSDSSGKRKLDSISKAARRLKLLLRWTKRKERSTETKERSGEVDEDSSESHRMLEENPIPLRRRYSKLSIHRSANEKERFMGGLMQGVIRVTPRLPAGSPSSPFSELSWSSSKSVDKDKCVGFATPSCSNASHDDINKQINRKRLMNKYFCFGAHGIALGDTINSRIIEAAINKDGSDGQA